MNPSIQGLLTVRDQACNVRDDAQRALQHAQRQCTQAKAQGQSLDSYRKDTAARWATPRYRSTDTVQMDTAHNFLARLDQALQQHEQSLQQSTALVERRRAELLAAETRLAGLDKLIARRQQQAHAQQERREQGASDQLAQRRPAAPQAHDEPADVDHRPGAPHQEHQSCPH